LGLRIEGFLAAACLPLALTALLFAGPLVALACSPCGLWAQRGAGLTPEVRLRNWLVAPLTEEFIYRSCLLSFLLDSGASPASCIWLSPLLFAASHLHHLHDLTTHQGLALTKALQGILFQLAYTTIFGWLAAFFFVRCRHLVAVVLPHAFCNFVGPPRLPSPGSRYRTLVGVCYLVGMLAFFYLLLPLTRPKLYSS
jgi:prenyl protein peptidase